jgi:hypothetical protein
MMGVLLRLSQPTLATVLQLLRFIKTLDPDWIWIGIQHKMLDPDTDPYQMYTVPKGMS